MSLHYAPPSSTFQHAPGMFSSLRTATRAVERTHLRKIFQVKVYGSHDDPLYRAYVSDDESGGL